MPRPTVAVVIPARLASSRCPRKPLLAETGMPMICHVVIQARKVERIDRLIVATPDREIAEAIINCKKTNDIGITIDMTSSAHENGTSRVAEVARSHEYDIFINVQGDIPDLDPKNLDLLIEKTVADYVQDPEECRIHTLVTRPRYGWTGKGRTKAVLTEQERCLYFSKGEDVLLAWRHIGMYGYSSWMLADLANLGRSGLVESSGLEQMAWLADGIDIIGHPVDYAHPPVDTPEDYAAFVERWRKENP